MNRRSVLQSLLALFGFGAAKAVAKSEPMRFKLATRGIENFATGNLTASAGINLLFGGDQTLLEADKFGNISLVR